MAGRRFCIPSYAQIRPSSWGTVRIRGRVSAKGADVGMLWMNAGVYRELDELRDLERNRRLQGRNDAILTALMVLVGIGAYFLLR